MDDSSSEVENHEMAAKILANSSSQSLTRRSNKKSKSFKILLVLSFATVLALLAFVAYLGVKIIQLEAEHKMENGGLKTQIKDLKSDIKDWKFQEDQWKSDHDQTMEEKHAHLHMTFDTSTLGNFTFCN